MVAVVVEEEEEEVEVGRKGCWGCYRVTCSLHLDVGVDKDAPLVAAAAAVAVEQQQQPSYAPVNGSERVVCRRIDNECWCP